MNHALLDRVQIVPASEALLPSFHSTLDTVAREKVYVEMLEAPSIEKLLEFYRRQTELGLPPWYAVDGPDKVVGWCDISPLQNPRMRHRGTLGMGLLPGFRGAGIGSRLLRAALDSAVGARIEKVELGVYTDNARAIALYRKFGFTEEGMVRDFRRVDGRTFDLLLMAKVLS